jgi:hypothetical protein
MVLINTNMKVPKLISYRKRDSGVYNNLRNN